jgi:hypothetical protein
MRPTGAGRVVFRAVGLVNRQAFAQQERGAICRRRLYSNLRILSMEAPRRMYSSGFMFLYCF